MSTPPPTARAQLWRGVQISLGLGGGAVALATVAGWTSRWWLVGELLSHFRLQFLWIAAVCAVVLAASRCWRMAALPAAAVLMNLAVILPLYWPATNDQTDGATLRLASINVLSRNPRHADVLALITDTRPDVVLFMEVTPQWQDLFTALEEDFPYQKTALRNDNFGIGFVSRVPLKSVEVRELGAARLPSIVAKLDWAGTPLTIVGTHPLPPAGQHNWPLRNDQFAALAALCRQLSGPLIMAGDLNCTDWSAHFGTLLDGTRLRDSRAGFGVQPTWPVWFRLPGIAIDHCLVSPEIVVRERFVGRDVGSDHFPLIVDLAIADAESEK